MRGVFAMYEVVNPRIGKMYLTKGTGKNKKVFVFTCFGGMETKASALIKGARIKAYFTIKCREYNTKWFTELILEDLEEWLVNEEKVKRECRQLELIEDKLYVKPSENNEGFLKQ